VKIIKKKKIDDPFHKNGLALVILVPGMVQSSGPGSSLMK
jgi:hypothetical protein